MTEMGRKTFYLKLAVGHLILQKPIRLLFRLQRNRTDTHHTRARMRLLSTRLQIRKSEINSRSYGGPTEVHSYVYKDRYQYLNYGISGVVVHS